MFTTIPASIPVTLSDRLPVPHAFTTRAGGVSTGPYASLNFRSNAGDPQENVTENMARLAACFGVGRDDCVVTKQVHGNVVRIVSREDRHICGSVTPYEADGLVTNVPGLPLCCFTADCVPVLLADSVHGVVAAVHCGWRSSVADILGIAVEKMCCLGAEPADIFGAIGPALGSCCFETHRDVPDAIDGWLGAGHGCYREIGGGKYLVDLKRANFLRLRSLGVPEENLDISPECTFCSHEKYWSHRFTAGIRGVQCAAIQLPPC